MTKDIYSSRQDYNKELLANIEEYCFITPIYLSDLFDLLEALKLCIYPIDLIYDNLYILFNSGSLDLSSTTKYKIHLLNLESKNFILKEAFIFLKEHKESIERLKELIISCKADSLQKAINFNQYLLSLGLDAREFGKNIFDIAIKSPREDSWEEAQDLSFFFKDPLFELYFLYFCSKNNIVDISSSSFNENFVIIGRFFNLYQKIFLINEESYFKFINRLKIRANLDPIETSHPQSGSFHFFYGFEMIQCRCSFHPLTRSEKFSIRILNSKYTDFDSLNIEVKTKNLLAKIILQRKIILIAGSTGTGKSTLAYSMVKFASKLGLNVLTLEDPVEYEEKSLNQSNNNCDQVTLLKSSLRHDIDLLFIGEMRDKEVASLVLEAATTGHGVIATLHLGNWKDIKNRWRELSEFSWENHINFIIFPKIVYKIDQNEQMTSSMLIEIYDSNGSLLNAN